MCVFVSAHVGIKNRHFVLNFETCIGGSVLIVCGLRVLLAVVLCRRFYEYCKTFESAAQLRTRASRFGVVGIVYTHYIYIRARIIQIRMYALLCRRGGLQPVTSECACVQYCVCVCFVCE